MSVSILHLKTGEHVICKLTELKDEQGNPFCFLMEVPTLLKMVGAGENDSEVKVHFSQWSIFSKSTQFRIGFDEIITIAEPKDYIYNRYIELIQPAYPILSPSEFEEFQEKIKQEEKSK
jgi:hypothetical protein